MASGVAPLVKVGEKVRFLFLVVANTRVLSLTN